MIAVCSFDVNIGGFNFKQCVTAMDVMQQLDDWTTFQSSAVTSVAALAIDKVGPRRQAYTVIGGHFHPGPTSGPTTRPGSQKK